MPNITLYFAASLDLAENENILSLTTSLFGQTSFTEELLQRLFTESTNFHQQSENSCLITQLVCKYMQLTGLWLSVRPEKY